MKQNTSIGMIGVLTVLFLAAVIALSAVVYGYSDSREKGEWKMHGTMSVMHEDMAEMHREMTRSLSPELKKQMDAMHETCEKYLSDEDASSAMM